MSAGPDIASPQPVFFERVLWPHRSLPPRGFRLLMLGLGFLSLVAGIIFVSVGAWPICGFFGLDVALLYLAFRVNYRSARQRETLRLADDQFTVERVGIYGERRQWRVPPLFPPGAVAERARPADPAAPGSRGERAGRRGPLSPP